MQAKRGTHFKSNIFGSKENFLILIQWIKVLWVDKMSLRADLSLKIRKDPMLVKCKNWMKVKRPWNHFSNQSLRNSSQSLIFKLPKTSLMYRSTITQGSLTSLLFITDKSPFQDSKPPNQNYTSKLLTISVSRRSLMHILQLSCTTLCLKSDKTELKLIIKSYQ